MHDSTDPYLIEAVLGLAGLVSTLALYIWRQEVAARRAETKARLAAERKLAEYEQPVREATAELLRLANAHRREERKPVREEGYPWPYGEDSPPRRRPRAPRRLS